MTTIAVSGHASRYYPAERGIVTVTVNVDGEDRVEVSDSVREIHNTIVEQARAFKRGGEATWSSADNVRTSSWRDHRKDEGVDAIVHRASSTIRVKFQDFIALSEWISTLVTLEPINVSVGWALTKATQKRAEKAQRQAAVADATEHAGDYARAVGAETPRLIAIYEPGLRPIGASTTDASYVRSAGVARGSGQAFDLQPAAIEIKASVTADFKA